MRLKQIKLAGFKSFVDLTKVPFPHQMTAIVGPNGCGKSNIIDAVRWVLGESSAKNLRGDAMTDVIFNGAKNRKPVGQASVELIFDNTDLDSTLTHVSSSAAAKLAERKEISIKRVVNRESINSYFLNGSKCRRRDITDVFLGTGLGPRSYAIIEQGMISRLIESKPQELRVYIEEAAGISQYKERRRETSLKIKHTQENLDRLNDIRHEVEQQIEKLSIQAHAAEQYKKLKSQERKLRVEHIAMQWQENKNKCLSIEEEITQASKREQEISLATKEVSDALVIAKKQRKATQQSFTLYHQEQVELGQQVAKDKQSFQFAKDQEQKNQEEKRNLSSQRSAITDQIIEAEGRISASNEQIETFIDELSMKEHALLSLNEQLAHANLKINELETQGQLFEQAYLQHKQSTKQFEQRAKLLNGEKERILKQLDRHSSMLEGHHELEVQPDELKSALKQLKLSLTHEEKQVSLAEQLHVEQESISSKLQQELLQMDTESDSLHKELKRIVSLNKQSATWQNNISNQLSSTSLFFTHIDIAEEWQTGLNTLLSNHLSAPVADRLVTDELDLAAVDYCAIIYRDNLTKESAQGSIAELIQSDIGIMPWLNHVMVANSLTQAHQMLATIAPHQSVICPDGTWLGHGFLIKGNQNTQEQYLANESRRKQLENDLQTLQQEKLERSGALEQVKLSIHKAKHTLVTAKDRRDSIVLQLQECQAHISASTNQLVIQKKQQAQFELEALELNNRLTQIDDAFRELSEEQRKLPEIEVSEDRANAKRYKQQLEHDVLSLQADVDQLTLAEKNIQRQLEQARVEQVQAMQKKQADEARIEFVDQRLNQLLQDQGQGVDLEQAEQQLIVKQEQLVQLASKSQQTQAEAQILDEEIENNEQANTELSAKLALLNEQLNDNQLKHQNHQLRCETMEDQLEEQQASLEEVLKNLPAHARQNSWQKQIKQTTQAINQLGAINLAAISEFEQHVSRKKHLDLQYEDLTQSISTLESAIAKIDQESRSKFKSTFDKVNKDLQSLFPKVFGGGSAYLELTSTDLLETGVTIMARPPGKKNSTIHLLSGGEKALTALSLVFAIFRLNPAPFCMLDEVDAPLDDANVDRFCNLVREMSQSLQFIYISHNKIAMEMASHLTGVTMFEPGVSRMVSVDIDEAIAMAEVS